MTATKTTEYTVVMEPEYGSPEDRAAKRRTMTLSAPSYAEAALAALRASGRTLKTVPKAEGRFHKDPETARRFVSRPGKDGDRTMVIVDLSDATKKAEADAKAAEKAKYDAEVAAMAPERAAWEALVARHPNLRVSVSHYEVRVEFSSKIGRVEVRKHDSYKGDGQWPNPTEISASSWSAENAAADLPTYLRIVADAADIARFLDATLPAGCGAAILADASYTANVRAHALWLKRIVDLLGTKA